MRDAVYIQWKYIKDVKFSDEGIKSLRFIGVYDKDYNKQRYEYIIEDDSKNFGENEDENYIYNMEYDITDLRGTEIRVDRDGLTFVKNESEEFYGKIEFDGTSTELNSFYDLVFFCTCTFPESEHTVLEG